MPADRIQCRDSGLTTGLCFLAAVAEGIDLQSMAIAAPKLIGELRLTHLQFGNAASMSLIGLLIGALVGGGLADRYGRKLILTLSLAGLGIFSLLTTLADSYGTLMAARALVGLTLGGSFPMLITLVSEAAAPGAKTRAISLMYAGVPIGTIIGTVMTLYFGPHFQWRWIFYVGGVMPLMLAPAIYWRMPESREFAARNRAAVRNAGTPMLQILFGAGRASVTLLLWISYSATLLVIYLITNWLNQLMASRGLSAAQATAVLLAWGIGGTIGSVALAPLADGRLRRGAALIIYGGVALSLFGLSSFAQFDWLAVSGFGAGLFAVAGSMLNYALAPPRYPTRGRATGVGWAVGVGRAGSIAGPLVGGVLLQLGLSASSVLLILLVPLIVACIATSALLWRPEPEPGAG